MLPLQRRNADALQEMEEPARVNLLRKATLPSAVAPWAWNTLFAKSMPMIVTVLMLMLLPATNPRFGDSDTSPLRREGHPLHQLLTWTRSNGGVIVDHGRRHRTGPGVATTLAEPAFSHFTPCPRQSP
jgi:hypothetical protein